MIPFFNPHLHRSPSSIPTQSLQGRIDSFFTLKPANPTTPTAAKRKAEATATGKAAAAGKAKKPKTKGK